MTDEPVNHSTREPHQPTYAIIVEGEYRDGTVDDLQLTIPYDVKLARNVLTRNAPGNVEFTLTINGKTCAQLPFDNLVKAATRIDPDHASGPEKQIRQLRKEAAEAKAAMYDWQAKAEQLEERLRVFTEAAKV